MGRRQYRRSVSLRPEVYVRAARVAAAEGTSITAVIEQAVTLCLDSFGAPAVSREEARAAVKAIPAGPGKGVRTVKREEYRGSDFEIVGGVG